MGDRKRPSRVAVRHDGAYAALRTETETGVVDLTTGRVVLTMGSLVPWSFSWDDAGLAVSAGGPIQNRGEVVDIANGQLLWIDPVAGRVTQGAISEPGSGALMHFATTGELSDLVVVTASGAYRTIAKNVFTAQIGPCPNCSAF